MIYFLQRANGDIKIGTTSKLYIRKAQLSKAHGVLVTIGVMDGGRKQEAVLHKLFLSDRVGGEWFAPGASLLAHIQQNNRHDISFGALNTFVIRTSRTTEAALDIFAAKWLAKTGKALTNDEAVEKLIELADPEALKQSKAAKTEGENEDEE